MGQDVEVVAALAGGTHAGTFLLRDASRRMVLRCFPEGDDAAANEAKVLTALDGLSGFAPRLLAADPHGASAGRPSTLITVLPGRGDIRPDDPNRAAVSLGRALARLHSVDAPAGFRDGVAQADATAARRGEPGPASAIVDAHFAVLDGEARADPFRLLVGQRPVGRRRAHRCDRLGG
ncbi:phosphotransferase family protein [Actinomadura syzygii]|nr:phosphotransferase [Actinomadura syzygii]